MSVLGHSFTYKGVDFAASNVIVQDSLIPYMSKPDTFPIGGGEGDVATDASGKDANRIQLALAVFGVDEDAFRANMGTLIREINPLLGPGLLAIDAIPGRQFIAQAASAISGAPLGMRALQFPLTFLSRQDAYGLAVETGQDSFTSGDPTATIAASESDLSTVLLPVMLYIQNTTGAQYNGTVGIANNSLPVEAIGWNGTINDDYWLRIGSFDSERNYKFTVDVSTASGSDPRVLSYTDVRSGVNSGIHPKLLGGKTNTIAISGLTDGEVAWDYWPRY